MTEWIMDESGNRTFTYAGWTVRVWSMDRTWRRIEVESPRGEQVEVWSAGLHVQGTAEVTIPWPVIEAVAEARIIVVHRLVA